jgi:hypothetical protein
MSGLGNFFRSADASLACDHAAASAHHLHAGNEWPRDERSPKLARSQERAGRGISCDSGGIIVRSSGDEAGVAVGEEADDWMRLSFLELAPLSVISLHIALR